MREFEENEKKFIGTRRDLFDTLSKFDINILGIPINIDYKKIINLVSFCDGIILPGGDYFLENDFKLVGYLYNKDIPTLGICLGMQQMAEFFNGREETHIKNHKSTEKYVHKINIEKNSLLYDILKKEEIYVNSRHKDAIPFTNIKVSAISEDGVIEAVEASDKKFFLGVQWHPESIEDENSYLLFDYLTKML